VITALVSKKKVLNIFCLFQNVHQGHPRETMLRFLKAREWNVSKAHKMVIFLIFSHPVKKRRNDILIVIGCLIGYEYCFCSL
jgi:hypothetical protein